MAQPNSLTDLIVNLAQRSTDSARAARDAEQAASAEALRLISSQVEGSKQLAANQQLILATQREGQLRMQDQLTSAITETDIISTLQDTMMQMKQRQDSLTNNLNALRIVNEENPGVGPFAAIARAISGSEYRRAAELDVAQLQQLSAGANQLQQSVGAFAEVTKANTKTITQASINAEVDNVALLAQQQQYQALLEGVRYNVAGVKAAAAADDVTLRNALTVANFGRQEQQFELMLRRENRLEASERKKDEDEAAFEGRVIQLVNLGEANLGRSPSTPQQIRDSIRLNKGISAEYAALMRRGETFLRTGQAIVAETPAEVAQIYAQDPTLMKALPDQQKKVAELIQEATGILRLPANQNQLAGDKTGQVAARLVNEQVRGIVRSQLAFVGNNPENIFHIGDLRSYIGSREAPGVAAFQRYPLVQKVYGPAIEANIDLTNPAFVFKLAVDAAIKGEISTAQAAADFSNIYRRASALHRAGMDVHKFGIVLPENGAQYVVNIEGLKVDATDFQQVAAAMSRSYRSRGIGKTAAPWDPFNLEGRRKTP